MQYLRRLASAAALLAVLFTAGPQLRGIAQRGFPQLDTVPAGSRVEYKTFQSRLLGRELRYGIYLRSSARFPVLYFLHGLNENEMRWSSRGRTDLMLDQMVADGRIGEFIVALPFGSTSFYTNTRLGNEPWEDMITKEFIPMIESAYRVAPARSNRGISGISMGGYGCFEQRERPPSGHVPRTVRSHLRNIEGFDLLGCQQPSHARSGHQAPQWPEDLFRLRH
jgi:hypothetical protein